MHLRQEKSKNICNYQAPRIDLSTHSDDQIWRRNIRIMCNVLIWYESSSTLITRQFLYCNPPRRFFQQASLTDQVAGINNFVKFEVAIAFMVLFSNFSRARGACFKERVLTCHHKYKSDRPMYFAD
jgi:hypothetical protein